MQTRHVHFTTSTAGDKTFNTTTYDDKKKKKKTAWRKKGTKGNKIKE